MTRKATYKDFPILTELFEEFLELKWHEGQYNLCLMQELLVKSFYVPEVMCAVIDINKRIEGFWLGYLQGEALFILAVYGRKPFPKSGFNYIENYAKMIGAKTISGIMSYTNRFYNELLLKKYGFKPKQTVICKEVGDQ